jgi:biopolymer transport protein ExbD
MKSPPPNRSQPLDQINITPLVDVCLVILLIFMVVTPLLVPGHAVVLPEASNLSPQPENNRAVTLSVDAAGAIYVGEQQVDLAQLSYALSGARTENPEAPVRMMGDGRVPFGAVKQVLRATQGAGFSRIALIIEKRTDAVQAATRAAETDARREEVPQ